MSLLLTTFPICLASQWCMVGASIGVDSFDVSLENQSVVVKGSAPYETVLEKIKKTGKEVKNGQVVH